MHGHCVSLTVSRAQTVITEKGPSSKQFFFSESTFHLYLGKSGFFYIKNSLVPGMQNKTRG